MNNITDWVKYELYPSLFESIDRAFPEHEFKRYSGGWMSKTYLDGSPHKDRRDKTVITKRAPGVILEQGGEVVGLIDYVMKRDNLGFIHSVKKLADVVGLEIPQYNIGGFSPNYNLEAYKKYKDQVTLLEDCNNYFIYCYENGGNLAKLHLEDLKESFFNKRGYSVEDIKAMELGYIPSQERLIKYLLSKGYSQSLIDEVIKLNKAIGDTHNITIPYRSGGVIKGFKFRTALEDITPKYLNSSGLDRLGGFFNLSGLKGDKDLVIVEGELDSLHATVKGIENVVATGGSSISSEQIKDAIKRGAKKFTLCFDTEPGKEETTTKNINNAIEVILAEGVNRVYIVTLPDLSELQKELPEKEEPVFITNDEGVEVLLNNDKVVENDYKKVFKTDPDIYLKYKGGESFKELLSQALPYYNYKLQTILNKYSRLEDENGELTYKEVDNLLEDVVEVGLNINEPIDRDRYKKASLDSLKGLGITEESLSITMDKLTTTKEKEAQDKELKKLLREAQALQEKGETAQALELLESNVKEVKLKDKATEFSSLLLPIFEGELRDRVAINPESLNSGYTIGGEELLLPSGAISVLAAPTSHGKTSFLINLALNVTLAYPDKQTYFFSYEEDGDTVLLNALNTYMNEGLSGNNRTTIKNNFAGRNSITLPATKDKFFDELINTRRLNINYSYYNSDTLIEAIRYLHKNTNIGSVFIDYIQLLNLPEGKYKTYSRQEEVKEICIALKDLAVETGLPIILGAQFNREVNNQLKVHSTKIGEAGDIERVANLIVGFYNNNFSPIATEGELNDISKKGGIEPNTLYTTILKNRGGKVGGEEILLFNGNTGKIANKNSLKNPF